MRRRDLCDLGRQSRKGRHHQRSSEVRKPFDIEQLVAAIEACVA
jgi:hypothetical protein